MSRSQLARTPSSFPRMKHRAAGRLARKRALQALPSFLEVMAQAIERAAAGIAAMAKSIAKAFTPEPAQSQYALTSTPINSQNAGGKP